MNNSEDWFRLKKYPHIGLPLKLKHKAWVESYVCNPDSVKDIPFILLFTEKFPLENLDKKNMKMGQKLKNDLKVIKKERSFMQII